MRKELPITPDATASAPASSCRCPRRSPRFLRLALMVPRSCCTARITTRLTKKPSSRASNDGLTLIHAFDDDAVIAGQGTLGLEILQQHPDIEVIVSPIGGGGLIGGIACAVKETKSCREGLRRRSPRAFLR